MKMMHSLISTLNGFYCIVNLSSSSILIWFRFSTCIHFYGNVALMHTLALSLYAASAFGPEFLAF